MKKKYKKKTWKVKEIVKHEKSAIQKKCKVQHEKSATLRDCDTKKVQNEECTTKRATGKKVQHEKGARWGKWIMRKAKAKQEKVQHGKCNISKV